MRVLVAVPTRGRPHSVSRGAVNAALARAESEPGVEVCPHEIIAWHVVSGRNHAVRLAIDGGFDWLWMVDDDVVPPAHALVSMLRLAAQRTADAVSAVVPYWANGRLLANVATGDGWLPLWPARSAPISRFGTACLLLRVARLRELEFPWFVWHESREGPFLGEDVAFAERVAAAGWTCWMDASVRCDHVAGDVRLARVAELAEPGCRRRYWLGVVGAPRSGTRYFSLLGRAWGMDLGHECHGEDGIVGWWYAARGAREPPGFCPVGVPPPHTVEFRHVLLLVRDPLRTIGSIAATHVRNDNRAWYDYASRYVRLALDRERPLWTAAEFWAGWLRLCLAQRHDRVVRVEEADRVLPGLAAEFGRELRQSQPAPPPDVNASRAPAVPPEQMRAELPPALLAELADLAAELGYDDTAQRLRPTAG